MEKSKSGLTRIVQIHGLIKKNTYPNVKLLSEKFEVSKRTIEHDIQYMKDQLAASIQYCRQKRGYYYSNAFELPPLNFSEEEIISIFLGQKILNLLKGTPYAYKMKSISLKLEQILTGRLELAFDDFDAMISFAVESLRGDELQVVNIFSLFCTAIKGKNVVRIKYFTISRNSEEYREVEPYKVHYYDGVWYLIGYCYKNNDFRVFAIDRIKEIEILNKLFEWRDSFCFEDYFKNSWGVMRGKEYTVKLKFDSDQAKYIREKKWHESQVNEELDTGELIVCFKATGLFEIKKWILGYGKHVLVIEPEELKNGIKQELQETLRQYF